MKFNYPVKKKLSLKENIAGTLPLVYDNFMSYKETVIAHPRRKDMLHKMRISGKPMRYAMELLENHSGRNFKNCLEEVKYIIELMGDIHDCDVFIPELLNHLKEVRTFNNSIETRNERITTRPLRILISLLRTKRNEKFKELILKLNHWVKQNFRRQIINSVQANNEVL